MPLNREYCHFYSSFWKCPSLCFAACRYFRYYVAGILGVNICNINSYEITEISYVSLILSYINLSNFSVEQFSSGRSDLYSMEMLKCLV